LPTRDGSTPSLSVIIPARNEVRTIVPTLKALEAEPAVEVIVVDGQSSDNTAEVARRFGATVIRSPSGRGRQMNAGAAAAAGELLVFLHADTVPPPGFAAHVTRILDRPGVCVGAFRLRIDDGRFLFRVIERLVDVRSRVLRRPYGDQAIFVTADVFRQVNGYPEWPIMEDVEFLQRVRRLGRMVVAPVSVTTSARRWIERGFWRTTLMNQACIAAHWAGASHARIASWRSANRQSRTGHPDRGRLEHLTDAREK